MVANHENSELISITDLKVKPSDAIKAEIIPVNENVVIVQKTYSVAQSDIISIHANNDLQDPAL